MVFDVANAEQKGDGAGLQRAARIVASIIESARIGMKSKCVDETRLARMRENMARFVDQEAMYVINTESTLVMLDYVWRVLNAAAERADDDTNPAAVIVRNCERCA